MIVELNNNIEIIKDFYYKDKEFISFFPKEINHSINLCLEKSLKEFKENSIDLYVVKKNNDTIGYFGIQNYPQKSLFTFFLDPQYRQNKDIFWKKIVETIKYPFIVGMVERNPRALKFLFNKGGKLLLDYYDKNKDHVFILEFKGDN